jgi:hypothetical protein
LGCAPGLEPHALGRRSAGGDRRPALHRRGAGGGHPPQGGCGRGGHPPAGTADTTAGRAAQERVADRRPLDRAPAPPAQSGARARLSRALAVVRAGCGRHSPALTHARRRPAPRAGIAATRRYAGGRAAGAARPAPGPGRGRRGTSGPERSGTGAQRSSRASTRSTPSSSTSTTTSTAPWCKVSRSRLAVASSRPRPVRRCVMRRCPVTCIRSTPSG